MGNPKPAMKVLFEAFCVMWNFKDGKQIKKIKDPDDQFKKISDYFTACKTKIFNDPGKMLKELATYDEEKINNMDINIINRLKKMVETEEGMYKEFNFNTLDRISEPSGKLFKFIECILGVYQGLVEINPRREALAEAEAQLAGAEKDLKNSEDNLKAVEDKIAALKAQLQEA